MLFCDSKYFCAQKSRDGTSSGASGVGSQDDSTPGSEQETCDGEDDDDRSAANSEEESELEALRLAALITKKENDPDRQVSYHNDHRVEEQFS